MSHEQATLQEQLQSLDLAMDVLQQHLEIIDRKIDTLEARFARIERWLGDRRDPAAARPNSWHNLPPG